MRKLETISIGKPRCVAEFLDGIMAIPRIVADVEYGDDGGLVCHRGRVAIAFGFIRKAHG